jgi:hypothetical protein
MLLGCNACGANPLEAGLQKLLEKGMVVSSAELSKREQRIAAMCENVIARTQHDR